MAANQNTIRRFEETPLVGTTCQNPPRANAQVLDSIQALRQNDSPFRPYFAQVGVGAVCGKAARTDLCGGRSAMGVPTATLPDDHGGLERRPKRAVGILPLRGG